jgi:hypothetical protein
MRSGCGEVFLEEMAWQDLTYPFLKHERWRADETQAGLLRRLCPLLPELHRGSWDPERGRYLGKTPSGWGALHTASSAMTYCQHFTSANHPQKQELQSLSLSCEKTETQRG